jgi:prolipoprotein diacylglyceryltransferase
MVAQLAIGFAIFFAILFVALFSLIVLGFVLWVMMLVDCAKRDFKNENDKVVWILVIVLTGIIGAIIYYFIIKRGS